jgi:uncharacterized peroxidase-related enzyme
MKLYRGAKMAYIEIIHPDEATGKLQEEYAAAMARAGHVAHILQVQSQNAGSLHASIEMYKAIMFGKSGLSRAEREMLATVVSQVNHCFY